MAQNESDREDLMGEAVSLVRRIECRAADDSSVSVMGFNELGWLFVYRGHDPMYRFDDQQRLRRAFVDGLLYRTEGKTLAQLTRRRDPLTSAPEGPKRTSLVRRDLSVEELDRFRHRMHEELKRVIADLRDGVTTRQFPQDEASLREEILAGLTGVLTSTDFLAPAIVRRRG